MTQTIVKKRKHTHKTKKTPGVKRHKKHDTKKRDIDETDKKPITKNTEKKTNASKTGLKDERPKVKRKYATTHILLNDNFGYVLGACVMANSLKRFAGPNRVFDTTIMIAFKNPKIEKFLKKEFDRVFYIPIIEYKVSTNRWKRFDKNYEHWLAKSFTKINVYNMTDYEKVFFLDADMVCLGDINHVFNWSTPSGCLTFQDKKLLPTGIQISQKMMVNSLKEAYGISGACFLIEPSKKTFDWCINRLKELTKNNTVDYWENCKTLGFGGECRFNAGPDEQLISVSEYFGKDGMTNWKNISRSYNSQPWLIKNYDRLEKVCIVHYVQDKPWGLRLDAKEGDEDFFTWKDNEMWFDAFEHFIEDIPEKMQIEFDLKKYHISKKRFKLTE